jgi:hypothetical protein
MAAARRATLRLRKVGAIVARNVSPIASDGGNLFLERIPFVLKHLNVVMAGLVLDKREHDDRRFNPIEIRSRLDCDLRLSAGGDQQRIDQGVHRVLSPLPAVRRETRRRRSTAQPRLNSSVVLCDQ